LTWKNRQDKTVGNFIPAIKIFKHLRTQFKIEAVSFHIECFLFRLQDSLFLGSPADYLQMLFEYISATSAADWYAAGCLTPCGDRNVFTESEWNLANWTQFHEVIKLAARGARLANQSLNQSMP
jgi:hypothetical protein